MCPKASCYTLNTLLRNAAGLARMGECAKCDRISQLFRRRTHSYLDVNRAINRRASPHMASLLIQGGSRPWQQPSLRPSCPHSFQLGLSLASFTALSSASSFSSSSLVHSSSSLSRPPMSVLCMYRILPSMIVSCHSIHLDLGQTAIASRYSAQ
jgi:hypothetical protein